MILTNCSFRQYYLPPYVMVTKDFLKDVLSDEKKLLKMEKVRFINPPLYDELSVKSLCPKIIGLDGMEKYFPS